MKKGIFLLLIFLLFYGCGHQRGQEECRIIEEDGIPVAANSDHPLPKKDGPHDIIFTEDLTIGARGGDPHYIFSDLISYTVDDEGCIYVLDSRQQIVKKFDPQGRYLLSFGKRGQGPGEFVHPVAIRFIPKGQLVVFELESQKYSFFDKNGQFIGSNKFQSLMYPPYFGFSNGDFIATKVEYGNEKTLIIEGLFNSKSELLFSFYQRLRAPLKAYPRNDPNARAKRLAAMLSRNAFQPRTEIAVDKEENIYFAFTDKYEIKIYSVEAKLKTIIKTNLSRLPVEDRDRQDFLNFGPKDITTWRTMDKGLKNKIMSLIKFPEKKPAFIEIVPMENNYLMVIRDGWFRHNSLIDIFDPQGRFIIEKRLPFCLKDSLCSQAKLYSIYEDEEGYLLIKGYCYRFF